MNGLFEIAAKNIGVDLRDNGFDWIKKAYLIKEHRSLYTTILENSIKQNGNTLENLQFFDAKGKFLLKNFHQNNMIELLD